MGNSTRHTIEGVREKLIAQFTSLDKEQYLQYLNNLDGAALLLLESCMNSDGQIKNRYMDIVEVKDILNYKDVRSVLNWCGKNTVFVLQQGNRFLVNKLEFLMSFHKPFISHLKRKHKNWKEVFVSYVKGDLSSLLNTPNDTEVVRGSYKPKNKTEVSFLNKIKNI